MAILQHKPNRIEDAIEKLTPLVYKLAHKFARNHKQDFDDLVQEGMMGLMQAYNRFDATKGSAFSSYAYQWAMALMNDQSRKRYKTMNNTAFKPVEEYHLNETYSMPLDDKIDFDRVADKADPTTKAIIVARRHGYNYREIAEGLTKLGNPHTLHQCRNKYEAALK